MVHFYKDYRWEGGKPLGLSKTENSEPTYRILADPYHKRYSIERYEEGQFKKIVYDSAIFDFRSLKNPEFERWRREKISEAASWIRNGEDRVVLKEIYFYEGLLPRECHFFHPEGIFVARHRIFYTHLEDPFNGTTLFDIYGKPVLVKKYLIDPATFTFTDLLENSWSP